MRANACVRMRYGATAPMIGPMLTKAADVQAPASATNTSKGTIGWNRIATKSSTPYPTTNPPARRTTPSGFLRNTRSYRRPVRGMAASDAIDVSDSIHPRVYAS